MRKSTLSLVIASAIALSANSAAFAATGPTTFTDSTLKSTATNTPTDADFQRDLMVLNQDKLSKTDFTAALQSTTTAIGTSVGNVGTAAGQAQSTATKAQQTANTAQQTANTANKTANTAQQTASRAQSTAQTALHTVQNVQSQVTNNYVAKADYDAGQKAQDSKIDLNTQHIATNTQAAFDNAARITQNKTALGTKADSKDVTDLAKRVTTNEGDIAANKTALTGKVDQTAYDAGQAAQDKLIGQKADQTDLDLTEAKASNNAKRLTAVEGTANANKAAIATNTTAIGTKADKADVTAEETRAKSAEKVLQDNIDQANAAGGRLYNKVVDETNRATAAEGDLQKGIDANKAAIATNTTGVATNKADIAKLQQQATGQNAKNSAFLNKNKTQDSDIAANKAAIAAETTRAATAEQKNATDIAANKTALTGKVDQTTYDAGQKAQDQKISDNAAEIATTKTNVNKINDGLKQEVTDRKAADAALQTAVNGKADKAQVNALATSTSQKISAVDAKATANATAIATKVDTKTFTDDQALQDKAIAKNAGDLQANTLKDAQQQKAIDANAADITANKTALGTKASTADLNKATQGILANASAISASTKAQAAVDAKQDSALTSATQAQAKVDAKQDGTITAIGTKVSTQGQGITRNANDLKTEVARAKAAEQANAIQTSKKVDQTAYDAGQAKQDAALKSEQQTRLASDQQLAQRINDRVTTATYTAGQNAQDKALHDETTARANAEKTIKADVAANKSAIGTKADKADLAKKVDQTAFDAGQKAQDQKIAGNTSALAGKADKSAVTNNASHISTNSSHITANTTAIAKETQLEAQHFTTLSAGVKQAQSTGVYAQARANQAFANAEANRQALANTNAKVAANSKELANHEKRITDLESQTNGNFSKLKSQVEENKRDADAGIAGVAALTEIPGPAGDQDFSIGAGVGTRNNQQAVALGFSARITENVVTKAGIAADTNSGFTAGAGISYGWK